MIINQTLKWILCGFFLYILFSCESSYNYSHKKTAGIAFSFDDRSIKEWFEIRDLLNEHDFKVTFFITQIDSLSKNELEMLKLLKADGHEIGSHGDLHLLSEYYIKENSLDDYIHEEIIPSIKHMKQKGYTPTSFAYPYGAKYWGTDKELLKYFYVLRSVAPLNKEKDLSLMDDVYYSFDGTRTISALGIDTKVTIQMIKKGFERALKNQEIIFLYGHVPGSTSGENYSLERGLLEKMISLADSMGLKSYTMSEIYL